MLGNPKENRHNVKAETSNIIYNAQFEIWEVNQSNLIILPNYPYIMRKFSSKMRFSKAFHA